MEELLAERIGRRIEVMCGAACLRGEIVQLKNGVLHLDCDKDMNFIAVARINSFKDINDENNRQVGF
jgi:hypothetical protein